MNLMFIVKIIAVLLLLPGFLPLTSAVAEPLPVSSFASLPDVRTVLISPDGNQLASLVRITIPDKSGTMLSTVDLNTGKQTLLLRTDNKKFLISKVRWANSNTLLVHARFPAHRGGTPTTETRLLIVDTDTKLIREAISKRHLRTFGYTPQIMDRVVDILPNDENHILMAIDSSLPGEAKVFKVSLVKEKLSTIQPAKSNIQAWLTDKQHKVRIGRYYTDAAFKILHRFPGERKWQALWEFEAFSEHEVSPMGFGPEPQAPLCTGAA